MYLENRDMDDMKNVYMTAWRKGLKTTYYLHMKPRHTAEQSTTVVNKAEMTGKRGFAAIKNAAAGVPADAVASPLTVSVQSPITAQEQVAVPVAKAETLVASEVSSASNAQPSQIESTSGQTTLEDAPTDPADNPNVCIACQ